MSTGAITQYIDVAQLVLYAFWIFFAGLIIYLQREMKREGYPLESDRSERAPRVKIQGFPAMPEPKTYLLRDGRTVVSPRQEPREEVRGTPIGPWPGAPLEPDGDPMTAEVGPGAYARRADIPDTTLEGAPRIVPLRADPALGVSIHDTDPRGQAVFGADGVIAGDVVDLWADRTDVLFRFLEIELANGGGRVLAPVPFARLLNFRVQINALLASQFAGVPRLRNPDVITLLEEEKIAAYYAAGKLYATPERQEPLL